MHPITEHVVKTDRHTTFYLACGPESGTPIIFLHGWPELSISWRHQLPVMAGLGFRAIAPDMRGYGRSRIHPNKEDYAVEHIEKDMLELLDALGAKKAIWVGHDWGTPIVWSLAQQHAGRCQGVAGLCVPYIPGGFTDKELLKLANRDIYPEDGFPAAQWDYWYFYRDQFETASGAFEKNVTNTVRALFRAGDPANVGQPAMLASIRANGGWFGPDGAGAPEFPRDESVITEQDENAYAAALTRNGFKGPAGWYVNSEANGAYAEKAKETWQLNMPVLFLHAAFDTVCETIDSKLAEPMRVHCCDLSEETVESGHWMAQEKPNAVNAALAKWLATKHLDLWMA